MGVALLPQAAHATFRGSNGKIAYSSGGSVYAVNPLGSGRSRLSAGGTDADPAFSPLGLRISFERTRSRNRDVWVMHADGTGQRRLTYSSALDADPAWSPSGGKLAWTRSVRGNWDVHTMNADGTGFKRITTSPFSDYFPAWSQSGKIALVRNQGGNHDIYTINPSGGGLKRLTRSSAKDTSPSWSPDSRKIAFVRSGVIHTINSDGRGLRRLPTGGLEPKWSPDGTKIAFSRGSSSGREVYVMNRDGRGIRRATTEPANADHPDWQATGHDPVIAGAGDTACDPASTYFNGGSGIGDNCRQRYTANLLLNMDLDKVVTFGDNQYQEGTLSQFRQAYDPSWGTRTGLKSITAPSVGNHEYRTPSAAGYFDYFNGAGNLTGPAGDPDKGYYSYDVGDWHVIVLNSACGYSGDGEAVPGGCDLGSPQHDWLKNDLATRSRPCTLAYFHHARFSSAENVRPFWDALYEAGAELVLNGHDHTYERFAPMTPSGQLDQERGIRQIIAGTGGKSHGALNTGVPNREVANNDTYGVLKLTLHTGSYEWRFVPESGKTFTDSGTTGCH